MGYLTAVFVLLFFFSMTAYRKSSDRRVAVLSIIMGFFALKNISFTYLYLSDDVPALSAFMFADIPVAVVTLIAMVRY